MLLGRRTYDEWARFWPDSEIEPFSTFINSVQKYVVTSMPLDDEWANTALIDGEVTAFVADLKRQTDGDLGVHGSISLAQTLLAADDLVDRLCLVVSPAVHVQGRKLFDGGTAARFSLTRSIASPSGHMLLNYEPRR